MLSVTHLESFLPAFLKALEHPKPTEWTVEMNPMTLTKPKLELFRHHGVTRSSLGVQAWDEITLEVLGRDHSPVQAEEAFQLLREVKFPVVSLDLMFSIPGQTLQDWCANLDKSISLQPDHISCYNLTYEEDTSFFERFQKGDYTRDEETDEAFFLQAMERLGAVGFEHYEISNYAQPGFESRHNQGYWKGNDYLGFGPSAVSTIDKVRTKNIPDTAQYMKMLAEGASPVSEAEHLTEDQWRCERLALELRTTAGIPAEWFTDQTECIDDLINEGFMIAVDNRLRLTRRGRLVADSVISHLWT